MKKDNLEKQLRNDANIIETYKNKYFFFGFISGIIPFIIVLSFIVNIDSLYENNLIDIILIVGISISILNAIIMKKLAYKRLVKSFNIKYNINYENIKTSL